MPSRAVAWRHEESTPWVERVARAREAVAAARSLDELAAVLGGPHFAALPLADLEHLPTFGGDRPRGTAIFSWDLERVLVMSDLGEGFELVRR